MASPLQALARERGITYFLISFTDLFGVARAKLVPAAAIDEMVPTGAGFAGFAAWLDMTPADPDLFAKPDVNSLIQLPWKPEVAWMAADLWMNDEPVAQAPRNVLKAALARAGDLGYQLVTGVECEFFLLQPDGAAVSDANDCQAKPCYDQHALMRRFDLITAICDGMQQLGWEPYQNDHEDANGQFEMNWKCADALTTADRHVFFKYMARSMAELHGLRATFMPKPFSHLTGNGCHLHLSLWDRDRQRNLFHDLKGELGLSSLAYTFLAGVMQSAPAICAFTNPTINSYRRLHAPMTTSGATWSPRTISYAGNNRTHMIRIPDAGRFELRLPDGAAHPYLMPAAVLSAGLNGVRNNLDPGPRRDSNLAGTVLTAGDLPSLPESLPDSLRALDSSAVLKEALGASLTESYIKLKLHEWNRFTREVTAWEREHTLDC
ncbi:MAG: type III glutamate--ammonia ligase [Planctomycetaceae bacterium]|nr:type III glutamate--ammonia ligase [Planctomycetaceae bacterium]